MELPFDDSTRPRPARPPGPPASARGRQGQLTLLAVHRHLRQELARVVESVAAIAAGELEPGTVRDFVHQTTMRRNYRLTGSFCAQYCQVVSLHHLIEDEYLFPLVGAADPGVRPVLDRLQAEHEAIHQVLVRIDQLLVLMMTEGSGAGPVTDEVRRLHAALLSHLDYEEEQLIEPIGRLSIAV